MDTSGTISIGAPYVEENSGPCPSCGYCRHCGRGGHQTYPYYPYYPYPWYSGPYTTFTGEGSGRIVSYRFPQNQTITISNGGETNG